MRRTYDPELKYSFADVKKLRWWMSAPNGLFERLLELIKPGQTKGTFFQWVNHRRGISASVAGDIERATLEISKEIQGVQVIRRGDVCEACSKCSYYLAGLENKEQNSRAE